MSEVLLPTWIVPEQETHEWLDEGSIVFPSAFAPGIAQRQSYGGLRLKMSRRHTVRAEEKAQLLSILQATRGRYNVLRTKVHFALRGAFPTSELLARNTFVDGTTGWASSNANITLTSSDRILRSTRANVVADSTIRPATMTTVNGATYVARIMALQSKGAMDYRQRLGTTAGASDISTDAADYTTQGFRSLVGTATGTSTFYSILDGNGGGTTRATGDIMDFSYTSVARCALVAGGSQTGNALTVDALPTSTSALLLPGDFFSVGGEIKFATNILDGDSSGAGYLQFEPALVRSPLDNDPIVIFDPIGKFLVSNIHVDNKFGTTAVVTYDLEHIYE